MKNRQQVDLQNQKMQFTKIALDLLKNELELTQDRLTSKYYER